MMALPDGEKSLTIHIQHIRFYKINTSIGHREGQTDRQTETVYQYYVQRSSSSLYRRLRYRNCLNYITLHRAVSTWTRNKNYTACRFLPKST